MNNNYNKLLINWTNQKNLYFKVIFFLTIKFVKILFKIENWCFKIWENKIILSYEKIIFFN